MGERRKTNCPACGREFEFTDVSDSPDFPFCSERCRLVDLDKWFDGDYKITTDIADITPDDRAESPIDGQKGPTGPGEKP